ncbi:DUF7693 family protein [Pseudomonas fontis]|uniref:DUF7693 domain-containing protein n=1 Tax=Pseudomonas fontis TaxID=2942633 RepID=A0ABT5NQJ1_9PSED|nr:hypothetical protein [Pseudomonas fontis]MDD0974636.1 hypothetical protein [Pseudomonas fontis]MDD0990421.1 hypothetical protein [Pseudomonas fontis]
MSPLSARETYQCLRDAAMGTHTLQRLDLRCPPGHVVVDIEGWQLTLDFSGEQLHHCQHCRCPDGRQGSLDTWQRYGTDPVSLLSTWELAQLEKLLRQHP